MNKKTFTKAIEQIHDEIYNKIPSINRGGCGIFALYMHKALNNLNISNNIEIRCGCSCDIDEKNRMFDNLDDFEKYELEDLSFSHGWISIPKFKFKLDGIITLPISSNKDLVSDGVYNQQQLEKAIELGQWNSDYRRKYNPLLKDIINNTFKILDNVK